MTVVTDSEAESIREFITKLIGRFRMEYGHSMALAGLSPEIIIDVQSEVARNVSEWLEQ